MCISNFRGEIILVKNYTRVKWDTTIDIMKKFLKELNKNNTEEIYFKVDEVKFKDDKMAYLNETNDERSFPYSFSGRCKFNTYSVMNFINSIKDMESSKRLNKIISNNKINDLEILIYFDEMDGFGNIEAYKKIIIKIKDKNIFAYLTPGKIYSYTDIGDTEFWVGEHFRYFLLEDFEEILNKRKEEEDE